MLQYFEKITEEEQWEQESRLLLKNKQLSSELINSFHTTWVVSGHRIRNQIANDVMLVKLLKHVLPEYSGQNIVLFRGENKNKWNEKSLGFCWTPSIDIAHMFASGLNSVPNGGLLLECEFKSEWIISSPCAHSEYLGENEYTVNPLEISNVKVLEEFKPI